MWPCVQGEESQPTAQAGEGRAGGFVPWKKSICIALYSVCVAVYTHTREKRTFPLTLSRERGTGNGGCDEINGYYEV